VELDKLTKRLRSQLVDAQATNYYLAGHLAELYRIRAGVNGRSSQWDEATADYLRSVQYAKELSSWRDLTQIDGLLAQAYEHQGKLQPAPDEQSTDDGLLQVREIRGLPLNASLATLSACNTGLGPTGESGVANIVNAFIEAGAQSVVSTLWELEDHASTHFMTVFYNHLSHHEEKAEALRQAKLDRVLSSLEKRFYSPGS
jgi:hypothetical protein